jgi:hypothetical protein
VRSAIVMTRARLALTAALAMALSQPATALEPIPETPGWRGFAIVGVGSTDLSSNLVVGNRLIDIGERTITSIAQGPQSDQVLHPVVTGEINYTFDNGWQAFLGTSLEDVVTLDAVTQVGARTNLGNAGTVQAGFLFSGIQTQAWEDPYAEGVRREDTNRDSTGVRLQWDRVMGSAFEMTFTYRDLSFDTERSGQGVVSVPCDSACQDLLRRDGDQYSFGVSHLYRLGSGRNHLVRPMLRYTIDDREGDAVAGDNYHVQLSYAYVTREYTIASNIILGSARRDEPNPLFGVETDSDRLVLDTTLLYRIPDSQWQAVASVSWGEDDSDVRFHDSRLFMVSLGGMRRFGPR